MDCKNLMIGDWVCFDGDEEYSYPVRIDGLTVSKEGADAGVEGDWCSQWQPIPLTDEILNANGFSKEGCFWSFNKNRFEYIFLRLFDEEDENEMSVEACEFFAGYWIVDENYRIKYVHELQHMLRVVGLTELADNFVIPVNN